MLSDLPRLIVHGFTISLAGYGAGLINHSKPRWERAVFYSLTRA